MVFPSSDMLVYISLDPVAGTTDTKPPTTNGPHSSCWHVEPHLHLVAGTTGTTGYCDPWSEPSCWKLVLHMYI